MGFWFGQGQRPEEEFWPGGGEKEERSFQYNIMQIYKWNANLQKCEK